MKPSVEGIGLITGKLCRVTLSQPEDISCIIFELVADSSKIPASLEALAQCDRSVTLVSSTGKTLSLVEHFLAACSLSRIERLLIQVDGPELPILEGGASLWLAALAPFRQHCEIFGPTVVLTQPVTFRSEPDTWIQAEPADCLEITYTVDFPHPELRGVTVRWAEMDGLSIARAGTFGSVSELPALQARGLALGVRPENTLGLTEDGQYTRPLRMPVEPAYHKILDCLGDLMLMGVNPLDIGMRLHVHKAGHASHTAFAKKLQPLLRRC